MKFSLQKMVRQTLDEAERREKLAGADESADGEESKGEQNSPGAKNTPKVNPSTAPERNDESIGEKTSSAFVSKLASAVEFCNKEMFKQAVGEVIPPPVMAMTALDSVGAGKGPNTTETNLESPTPGMQSEETGQASTGVVPERTGTGPASAGNSAPATSNETDMNDPPGGSEDWTKKDVMKQAAKNKVARVLKVMAKMAEDVPPEATESGEGVPKLPAEAAGQERLIDSLEAAINYTKQDAKAVPKERMGEVLDEPAQKKATDPVLQNNLEATSGAGVKISSVKAAAARALLQKIAEEGEKPDASPGEKEKAEKLKAILEAKQQEKSSEGFNPNQQQANLGMGQ